MEKAAVSPCLITGQGKEHVFIASGRLSVQLDVEAFPGHFPQNKGATRGMAVTSSLLSARSVNRETQS